jgi:hypothetical protein
MATIREFEVPQSIPTRNFCLEFQNLCSAVNAVNHGEFDGAVVALVNQANIDESRDVLRAKPLAIQRCRRGGKTFMLHAIASMINVERGKELSSETHVIFISLNNVTPYSPDVEADVGKGAMFSILSRIAWELSGREKTFINFRDGYDNFGAVDEWLMEKERKIILIVDELNIIPCSTRRYGDMSTFLDNIVQRKGCAILYSTHQRDTADLLRGRRPGANENLVLSRRLHLFIQIPRLVNEDCLHGLSKNSMEEFSFWSAVLRGRVPALVLQDAQEINHYTELIGLNGDGVEERVRCLKAVITGAIENLPNARNTFRAYSYMSERFKLGPTAKFAWPPFMVAQINVLGKDYPQLYTTLQNPCIDEAKAFEALTQLAVLVRLLTQEEHDLVPMNFDAIRETKVTAFDATELFFASSNATDIPMIIKAVRNRFALPSRVQQVVAVPMFASFPVYDFFVLHRTISGWHVAAGYQCKQGFQSPKNHADADVSMSVWLEGRCRKYRVGEDGERSDRKEEKGWIVLGENFQVDFLGVTVSEALPLDPGDENALCAAEGHCRQRRSSGAAERNGATNTNDADLPSMKHPRNGEAKEHDEEIAAAVQDKIDGSVARMPVPSLARDQTKKYNKLSSAAAAGEIYTDERKPAAKKPALPPAKKTKISMKQASQPSQISQLSQDVDDGPEEIETMHESESVQTLKEGVLEEEEEKVDAEAGYEEGMTEPR